MDEIAALITAARRYCMERVPECQVEVITVDDDWLSSDKPHPSFPSLTRMERLRQSYFEALLTEVEGLQDMSACSLHTAKDTVIALARRTVITAPGDRFASMVVEKARQPFITYVESISPEELQQVAPLPFRRVPCGDEFDEIWRRLDERWNISGAAGFWFPLNISEQEIPGPVIAFWLKDFLVGYGVERLQHTLMAHGITRVWEMQNILPSMTTEYEMDVFLLRPKQGQWDRYWTAEPMDWLIYASHEGTIAFAGEWLVDAILADWLKWRDCWHVPVTVEGE